MIRKLLSTVLKYLFEMKETSSLEYGLIDKQCPIHKPYVMLDFLNSYRR